MIEIESPLGISREEYVAGVRLSPQHPAFAGSYEDWIEATLKEIRAISQKRDTIAQLVRARSKSR